MKGVHHYKEGKGAYAGNGLYVTNEPGLGFVVALYVGGWRLYFRYRWAHPMCPRCIFANVRQIVA